MARRSILCTQRGRSQVTGRRAPSLLYKFRWWLLGTVVLLNLANYAHWIAFPAVAKKVTKVFREFFSKLKIFRPPLITR